MKFSEFPYQRPDKEALIRDIQAITKKMQEAGSAAEAREAFLAMDRIDRKTTTQGCWFISVIPSIRRTPSMTKK